MRTWYSQMDGLRFIAITTVLIEHFAYSIGSLFHAGYFGVDLFFVLSGFLITEGLLVNREENMPGKKAILHFYIKRFLRIFPIYYLFLVVAAIVYPGFSEISLYAFTYTVNYYHFFTGNYPPDAFSHLWSLSVEEQFYLFWPFLIIFIPNRKAVLYAILLVMAGSLIYFITYNDYVMLQSRMFSLCFGAVLAYAKLHHNKQYTANVNTKALVMIGLAVLVYLVQPNVGISIFSLSLVYLASNSAFRGLLKKFLEYPAVLHIGKISYGVYLYHKPLGLLITFYIFDPIWTSIDFSFLPALRYNSWIIKLPLYYACAVGVAHLSFRFIETPFLRLKKRLKEEPRVVEKMDVAK